ncbi:unnamed protein product [Sphenostylis stenocarpa]|uniref:Pectate lyase domain-containing protein n=1 Tax=Sphenostylis stenocarpa TaxID=92480 RepID=A0AA86T6U4_9FABA|nr:unnamed protein product [Sphenostylis stenocarpa]
MVMGHEGKVIPLGHVDGDAIRLVTASKIWIDHNTFYSCQDGLLDVTRGSTYLIISNNWFKNQDKVMLLGLDDGYVRDQNMKVTVVYNHFGPNCNQRMPRCGIKRHSFISSEGSQNTFCNGESRKTSRAWLVVWVAVIAWSLNEVIFKDAPIDLEEVLELAKVMLGLRLLLW